MLKRFAAFLPAGGSLRVGPGDDCAVVRVEDTAHDLLLKTDCVVEGVHFEPSFAAAALQTWDDWGFAVSHILANQWLVTGRYENEDGPERLDACVRSIAGGIDGIAFHDNLKGVYKDRFRALGAKLGIPAFKHQTLRRPETIAWADRQT